MHDHQHGMRFNQGLCLTHAGAIQFNCLLTKKILGSRKFTGDTYTYALANYIIGPPTNASTGELTVGPSAISTASIVMPTAGYW
jgi:hypothetical protein